MALKSMTGFARGEGRLDLHSWQWEARTVNGRGLDVRLRLPPGYEVIEQAVREACKKQLARGNCTLTLSVQRDSGDTTAQLNEEMFKQVVQAAKRAGELADAAPPTLDGLLSLRGVIETAESAEDESAEKARHKAILSDFEDLLGNIIAARTAEGEHIASSISMHLDEIESLVGTINSAPSRTPEAIGKRLHERLEMLIGEAPQLDEQRLHQEAVLLATKADVMEELDRLKAHIEAARELLQSDEPAGRRLEFLAQEFNRVANTICSKSNDIDVTQAGLALKVAIDRMREQVQNIE
ncbi:MAG: YicC/YloC family endoribonuclease [Methyloligellaceae bacterium]